MQGSVSGVVDEKIIMRFFLVFFSIGHGLDLLLAIEIQEVI